MRQEKPVSVAAGEARIRAAGEARIRAAGEARIRCGISLTLNHQKSMFNITQMMSTFDGPSVVEYKKWKARLRVIRQVTARAVLEIIRAKRVSN